MRKIIAVLLAMVMVLGLFVGCGKKDDEKVTITWLHHFEEPGRKDWVKEVAKKTMEKYDWITVDIEEQPMSAYTSTLQTKLMTDDAPALFDVSSRGTLEQYYKAGYCYDLSEETYFFENLMPLGLDSGKIDGGTYSLVMDAGGAVVFYNKKIFADLGLSAPQTYPEWINVLETIKASGTTPLAAGYKDSWVMLTDTWADSVPYLFENNENWAVDKMSKKTKFVGDERFMTIMEQYYERTKYSQEDKFGSDWGKATELIASEKTAMLVGGLFGIEAIKSKNKDIDLGVFAMPVDGDKANTKLPLGQPGGLVVYNDEKNPKKVEAAIKLLEEIFSKEMAGKFQELAMSMSVVKDVEGKVDSTIKDVMDIANGGNVISTSALPYSFTGEYLTAYVKGLTYYTMGKNGVTSSAELAKYLDAEFAKIG